MSMHLDDKENQREDLKILSSIYKAVENPFQQINAWYCGVGGMHNAKIRDSSLITYNPSLHYSGSGIMHDCVIFLIYTIKMSLNCTDITFLL